MKYQTSRILFMFIIMGFVLLGIGCLTDPLQNNQNQINQNTSIQNASNQISSSENTTPAPPKCDLSPEELEKAIPPQLKDQYNKNFTVTPEKSKLVFKGYIYGEGNILRLLNAFNKFRGKDCVNAVSFQGNTGNDIFYWCFNADCSPPKSPAPTPLPKCDIRSIVENSPIKDQLNYNLFYDYKEALLEFSGLVGDKPNNGQFTSLFAQLQNEMNNGCINKITFASRSKKGDKTLLNEGFEWTLCDPPTCDCGDGVCKACVLCENIVNKNANANRSNSP